tara:strand:- start:739 stop:1020 length:282 start_codon:yes stop_codon:yes gene_type:complete
MLSNPLLYSIKEEDSKQSDSVLNEIFRDSEVEDSNQSSEAVFKDYDTEYKGRYITDEEDKKQNIKKANICIGMFLIILLISGLVWFLTSAHIF